MTFISALFWHSSPNPCLLVSFFAVFCPIQHPDPRRRHDLQCSGQAGGQLQQQFSQTHPRADVSVSNRRGDSSYSADRGVLPFVVKHGSVRAGVCWTKLVWWTHTWEMIQLAQTYPNCKQGPGQSVRFGVRTSVKACNNCPFDYCRYLGKEEITNMVILDIKMLSGFVPDPESLKKVSCQSPVRLYRSRLVFIRCRRATRLSIVSPSPPPAAPRCPAGGPR